MKGVLLKNCAGALSILCLGYWLILNTCLLAATFDGLILLLRREVPINCRILLSLGAVIFVFEFVHYLAEVYGFCSPG